jgi:histidinol dehydrogenase
LQKAAMPVRLDRSSADFDQRFAAFLAAKREVSADVERATRASSTGSNSMQKACT